MEAPSNRQHTEKVIIKTLVASPDDTKEGLPTLFKQRAAMVEDYELRVAYDFPLHQQSSNLERSGAGSSRNASAFRVRNSSYVKLDRNRSSWDFLKKGIIVVISCLIFWYLTVQILSRLWTLISMIMVLVVKMMSNRAVEAAEDWIKRTLVYLCLYFLAAVRENLLDLCSRWLNVISNAFLDLLTAIFGHEERR
ncbi:hypothetical protein C2S52_005484 [Perilla frutescens var. hirtella]|uniref:Uncharacterized protein n=1 Tax=Perilla frutescens var. hirtella TaxID=608512 RepID=A0AAD4IWA7_PERFH|nr:hypothetical protein C2S52_005484 [Perilla frutescens var. hirtella]KAH6822303.1 hypothetical protein C2S53_019257 [Perilla frutescens var. hirtella]